MYLYICSFFLLRMLSRNDIRTFRWEDSRHTLAESVQVPLVDEFGIYAIQPDSERETRVASVRRSQEEPVIVAEGNFNKFDNFVI